MLKLAKAINDGWKPNQAQRNAVICLGKKDCRGIVATTVGEMFDFIVNHVWSEKETNAYLLAEYKCSCGWFSDSLDSCELVIDRFICPEPGCNEVVIF